MSTKPQGPSPIYDEAPIGWVAMEPFDYHPDGPTCAARAIGYVQGILETLA